METDPLINSEQRLRSLAGDDVTDAVLRGLAVGRQAFWRYMNDPKFHTVTKWMVEILKTKALTLADLRDACDMADAVYTEWLHEHDNDSQT